jgi:hypothetical protein
MFAVSVGVICALSLPSLISKVEATLKYTTTNNDHDITNHETYAPQSTLGRQISGRDKTVVIKA